MSMDRTSIGVVVDQSQAQGISALHFIIGRGVTFTIYDRFANLREIGDNGGWG